MSLRRADNLHQKTLQQLVEQGVKSVVNLWSVEESGALVDEQQLAEAARLKYVNIALKSTEADDELTAKVLAEVEQLPTPIHFHCGVGGRAKGNCPTRTDRDPERSRFQIL
jgi:protein tyrosine phosphatase (PTP) superfamily phosphohydrolase (DUF442 family)